MKPSRERPFFPLGLVFVPIFRVFLSFFLEKCNRINILFTDRRREVDYYAKTEKKYSLVEGATYEQRVHNRFYQG